ncbi:hypothetical protein T492DRAFT_1024253 [Pavlovales sp. CCMP2436]|nr:hypothetical protein T492DRAFT_1024253 [Pavlovales sp. CCMP2436]
MFVGCPRDLQTHSSGTHCTRLPRERGSGRGTELSLVRPELVGPSSSVLTVPAERLSHRRTLCSLARSRSLAPLPLSCPTFALSRPAHAQPPPSRTETAPAFML